MWISALRLRNQIQGLLLTANHPNQANVDLLTQEDNLIDTRRSHGICEADSPLTTLKCFALSHFVSMSQRFQRS